MIDIVLSVLLGVIGFLWGAIWMQGRADAAAEKARKVNDAAREEAREERAKLLAALAAFRVGNLEYAGMSQDAGDCWTDPILNANRVLREIERAPAHHPIPGPKLSLWRRTIGDA
jgi:hypothetical protein